MTEERLESSPQTIRLRYYQSNGTPSHTITACDRLLRSFNAGFQKKQREEYAERVYRTSRRWASPSMGFSFDSGTSGHHSGLLSSDIVG
jgi:hypothetical protein